jgi:TRAP-type uncharacterized transport system substrate-binding protein
MNACWPRLAICATLATFLCSGPACSACSGEPNWPDHLSIGTASPGSTYYVYGEGLAKILTRSLALPVVRLATEGPAQNIELLEAGEAKLGFVDHWHRAPGMERNRHMGGQEAGALHARRLSHVRHAFPIGAGQDQAAVLTVCRAQWSSNCAALK